MIMDNKTIELHTIATFQGKEYELENLLNGLLNKLEEKDKEIERLNNIRNNAISFIEAEVGIMAIDTDNYMSCDELTKCGIGCLWKILKEGK